MQSNLFFQHEQKAGKTYIILHMFLTLQETY